MKQKKTLFKTICTLFSGLLILSACQNTQPITPDMKPISGSITGGKSNLFNIKGSSTQATGSVSFSGLNNSHTVSPSGSCSISSDGQSLNLNFNLSYYNEQPSSVYMEFFHQSYDTKIIDNFTSSGSLVLQKINETSYEGSNTSYGASYSYSSAYDGGNALCSYTFSLDSTNNQSPKVEITSINTAKVTIPFSGGGNAQVSTGNCGSYGSGYGSMSGSIIFDNVPIELPVVPTPTPTPIVTPTPTIPPTTPVDISPPPNSCPAPEGFSTKSPLTIIQILIEAYELYNELSELAERHPEFFDAALAELKSAYNSAYDLACSFDTKSQDQAVQNLKKSMDIAQKAIDKREIPPDYKSPYVTRNCSNCAVFGKTQAGYQQEAKQVRDKLGNIPGGARFKKPAGSTGSGNIAVADVKINGHVTGSDILKGHSLPTKLTGIGKDGSKDDTLQTPEEKGIEPYFNSAKLTGHDNTHNSDPERKILEDVANRLNPGVKAEDRRIIVPEAKGVMELYTERSSCGGCEDKYDQFHRMFPNIKIDVITSGAENPGKK